MDGAVAGIVFVIIGTACVAFGLLTGAMPPFPSRTTNPISYRDEDPSGWWMNGACYAALTLYGCYLVAKHWSGIIQFLGV